MVYLERSVVFKALSEDRENEGTRMRWLTNGEKSQRMLGKEGNPFIGSSHWKGYDIFL